MPFISSKQFFTATIFSIVESESLPRRLFANNSPTCENKRSQSMEVHGEHRYYIAKAVRRGNLMAFSLKKSNTTDASDVGVIFYSLAKNILK